MPPTYQQFICHLLTQQRRYHCWYSPWDISNWNRNY